MAAALTGHDTPRVTHQMAFPSDSATLSPDCKAVPYQRSHPKLQAAQEERDAGFNTGISKHWLVSLQTGRKGRNFKGMIETKKCNSPSKRQYLPSARFSAPGIADAFHEQAAKEKIDCNQRTPLRRLLKLRNKPESKQKPKEVWAREEVGSELQLSDRASAQTPGGPILRNP